MKNAIDLKWIRDIRKEKGLTLKNVSGKTGLSISFLSEIERGITNPSLKTIIKILDAYEYSMRIYLNKKREVPE